MNQSQQAMTRIHAKAKLIAEGCTDCGGSGKKDPLSRGEGVMHGQHDYFPPCPTCAEARAVMGETCWHEWDGSSELPVCGAKVTSCLKCNKGISGITFAELALQMVNPDLTTAMHGSEPLVVSWMRRINIWDKFKRAMDITVNEIEGNVHSHSYTYQNLAELLIEHEDIEILINGELRLPAINSYLEVA